MLFFHKVRSNSAKKSIYPTSCRIFAALLRKIYDLRGRRIGRVWYTLPSRFAKNSSQIYDNLPPNTYVRENTYIGGPLFMAKKIGAKHSFKGKHYYRHTAVHS